MSSVSVGASEHFSELQICIDTMELLCARLLELCGVEQSAFNVLICDDVTMTDFNRRYRGVNDTTDVLSFPTQPLPIKRNDDDIDMHQQRFLGDLVISYPSIVRQSEIMGMHWFEEMVFVTVHGFYHLLGFDHAQNGDHDTDVMLITAARTAEQLLSDALSVEYLARSQIV